MRKLQATHTVPLERRCSVGKGIPDSAWKTHDLRSRTIRLVQSGLALARGGYRRLLRPSRRGE
ncbi:DNA -binding domain-containing protein [Bradyrhizobium elkanii]